MSTAPSSPDSAQRRELAALAEALRPELHRYCARLMGSVIDGEDVVQDALTKALVTASEPRELSTPRAWLFRVAHNRALDLLRSRAARPEPLEAARDVVDEVAADAMATLLHEEAIELAVARFTELPVLQRSVIILKDILGESLVDIASLLELSVDSVKAHLARGRSRLREVSRSQPKEAAPRTPSTEVASYVTLFNRRDWEGLRALLADDVKLQQSSHPLRVGAADVGMFFGIYAKSEGLWLAPAWLEDREVIAVFEESAPTPSYLMWLEWQQGKICFIRDYRYVRYVLSEAELSLSCPPSRNPQMLPRTADASAIAPVDS